MKIQSMFQKDINREINGVIKVSPGNYADISALSMITTPKPLTVLLTKLGSGFQVSLEAVNPIS